MFDKSGFVELCKDSYVFHGFVSDDDCNQIVLESESISEDNWWTNKNETITFYERSVVWLEKIIEVDNRVISLLEDGYYLGSDRGVSVMRKGYRGAPHSDNHDSLPAREASKIAKDLEEFDLAEDTVAGIVLYFNDFDGAEISYINQGVSYSPKKGDLIIHSAEDICFHEVKELKSDIRYFHSNKIFKKIKVPKGFNYAT
jgi:hypothetical protein